MAHKLKRPTKESFKFETIFRTLLESAVELEPSGPKGIKVVDEETGETKSVDISNFIFSNTDGGTQPVTLIGTRARDSKSDPSKRAGDDMKINGRIKYKYRPTGGQSPLGSATERYKNYDIITLLVSSVDGKAYPKSSIRNIKANTIKKMSMGGKTYTISK